MPSGLRRDVEMGPTWMPPARVELHRDGYPGVAEWMFQGPAHDSYVFRRFDKLSARNLLFLQSELIKQEAQIEELDQEARELIDLYLNDSARSMKSFAESNDEIECKRRNISQKIIGPL